MIEYTGEGVRGLSMEGRMTVCNMSIEGGARAGMVAPDETTFEYVRGSSLRSPGARHFEQAVEQWRTLPSDARSNSYDRVVEIDAPNLQPFVTWGTNPRNGSAPITARVPDPASFEDSGSYGRPLSGH